MPAETTTLTYKAEADFRDVDIAITKLERRSQTVRSNLSNITAQIATTTDPKQTEILRKRQTVLQRELASLQRAEKVQRQRLTYHEKTLSLQREQEAAVRRALTEQKAQAGWWKRVTNTIRNIQTNLKKVDDSGKTLGKEFDTAVGITTKWVRRYQIIGARGFITAGLRTLPSVLSRGLGAVGVGGAAGTALSVAGTAGIASALAGPLTAVAGRNAALAAERLDLINKRLDDLARQRNLPANNIIQTINDALQGTTTALDNALIGVQALRANITGDQLSVFLRDIASLASLRGRDVGQTVQDVLRSTRQRDSGVISELVGRRVAPSDFLEAYSRSARKASEDLSEFERRNIRLLGTIAILRDEVGDANFFASPLNRATIASQQFSSSISDLYTAVGGLTRVAVAEWFSDWSSWIDRVTKFVKDPDVIRWFNRTIGVGQDVATQAALLRQLPPEELERRYFESFPSQQTLGQRLSPSQSRFRTALQQALRAFRTGGASLFGEEGDIEQERTYRSALAQALKDQYNNVVEEDQDRVRVGQAYLNAQRRVNDALAKFQQTILSGADVSFSDYLRLLSGEARGLSPQGTTGRLLARTPDQIRLRERDRNIQSIFTGLITGADFDTDALQKNVEYLTKLPEAIFDQAVEYLAKRSGLSKEEVLNRVALSPSALSNLPGRILNASDLANLPGRALSYNRRAIPALPPLQQEYDRRFERDIGTRTELDLQAIQVARRNNISLDRLRKTLQENNTFQRQNIVAGGISGAIENPQQRLDEVFLKLYDTVELTDQQWEDLSEALGRSRQSIEDEIEARSKSQKTFNILADVAQSAANALGGFLFGGRSIGQTIAGFGRSLALSGFNSITDKIVENIRNAGGGGGGGDTDGGGTTTTDSGLSSGQQNLGETVRAGIRPAGKLAVPTEVQVNDDFYTRSATAYVDELEASRRRSPYFTEDLVRIDRRSLDRLESGLQRVVVREQRITPQTIPPPHIGVLNEFNITARTDSAVLDIVRGGY